MSGTVRERVESALRRGLTQAQTARLVGCSRSYVERISLERTPGQVPSQTPLNDAPHWRACLAAGGFVWRELRGGQVIEFRPRAG